MKKLVMPSLALIALLLSLTSCDAKAGGLDATVKGLFTQITQSVASVKDDASATAANTKITGIVGQIKKAVTSIAAKALPAETMATINKLIGGQKGEIIKQISALAPGLKGKLSGALTALQSLGK